MVSFAAVNFRYRNSRAQLRITQRAAAAFTFRHTGKAAGCRRNVDDKETAGKEGDKNFRPMDFRKTMPVKIGKRGEKRGSGRESPEGEN